MPWCFGTPALQYSGIRCPPVLQPPLDLRASAHSALGALVPSVPQCSRFKHPWCLLPSGLRASVHPVHAVPPVLRHPRASALQSGMPSVLVALRCFGTLGASQPQCFGAPEFRCPRCSSPLCASVPSGPRCTWCPVTTVHRCFNSKDVPQCFGTFRHLSPLCALAPSLLRCLGASAYLHSVSSVLLHPWYLSGPMSSHPLCFCALVPSLLRCLDTPVLHWLTPASAFSALWVLAPISPGHTFGPAVEEILQRSHQESEASRQIASMLPSRTLVGRELDAGVHP
ncbi:UNVERIFIED_CONTAM: hypothetical protein FKN15_001508 [Acipenser sinensis]